MTGGREKGGGDGKNMKGLSSKGKGERLRGGGEKGGWVYRALVTPRSLTNNTGVLTLLGSTWGRTLSKGWGCGSYLVGERRGGRVSLSKGVEVLG